MVFADACEMGLRMQTDFPSYGPRTFFYPSNSRESGLGFQRRSAVPAAGNRVTICVVGRRRLSDGASGAGNGHAHTREADYHRPQRLGAWCDRFFSEGSTRAVVDTELDNPISALAESFGTPAIRATTAAGLRQLSVVPSARGRQLDRVQDRWRQCGYEVAETRSMAHDTR